MPRNPEVDRLREISDQLFHARQAAHDRMKLLGQRRHDLKDQLDASWERVGHARDEKNAAYERQQSDYSTYRSERDDISAQIDDVARSADEEHSMGRECAEASQDAYASGDKESAAMYKSDKEDHYYRRDDFNAEKARLIDIAKSMTPPHSDFHYYKERYDNLMESHGILQAEYREVKAQHETARAEFDRAKECHEEAQEAFNQALAVERAKWHDEKCQDCGDTIRINTDWSHPPKYCKACKEKFARQRDERSTLYGRFRTAYSPIEIPAKVFWDRNRGGVYHLTMKYSDGYRVSWNATESGDKNFHWTNENLQKGHKDRHVPPPDCRVSG